MKCLFLRFISDNRQNIRALGLLTAHFVRETFWWNPFQIRLGYISNLCCSLTGCRQPWSGPVSVPLRELFLITEPDNSAARLRIWTKIVGLFDYIYISVLHTMDRIFIFYHNVESSIIWAVRTDLKIELFVKIVNIYVFSGLVVYLGSFVSIIVLKIYI